MIIVQQRGTKKVEPRLREIELMSHLSVALDWEFAGPQLIGETGLADRVARGSRTSLLSQSLTVTGLRLKAA